jgi:hypothetical protein
MLSHRQFSPITPLRRINLRSCRSNQFSPAILHGSRLRQKFIQLKKVPLADPHEQTDDSAPLGFSLKSS